MFIVFLCLRLAGSTDWVANRYEVEINKPVSALERSGSFAEHRFPSPKRIGDGNLRSRTTAAQAVAVSNATTKRRPRPRTPRLSPKGAQHPDAVRVRGPQVRAGPKRSTPARVVSWKTVSLAPRKKKAHLSARQMRIDRESPSCNMTCRGIGFSDLGGSLARLACASEVPRDLRRRSFVHYWRNRSSGPSFKARLEGVCSKASGTRWHILTFGSHGSYRFKAKNYVCDPARRTGADTCHPANLTDVEGVSPPGWMEKHGVNLTVKGYSGPRPPRRHPASLHPTPLNPTPSHSTLPTCRHRLLEVEASPDTGEASHHGQGGHTSMDGPRPTNIQSTPRPSLLSWTERAKGCGWLSLSLLHRARVDEGDAAARTSSSSSQPQLPIQRSAR